MLTIFKYQIPIQDEFHVAMPRKSRVLCVQVQDGIPCIWAIVDSTNQLDKKIFALRGTGHELDRGLDRSTYVGTFQLEDDSLVFHLFERGVNRLVS